MRLSNRILLLSLLLGWAIVFATVSAVFAARDGSIGNFGYAAKPPETLGYAPGQVLVEFRDGLSTSARKRLAKEISAEKTVKRFGATGHKTTYLYDLSPGKSVSQAVKELNKSQDVLAAEPNYRRKLTFLPNDPYLSEQYGLDNFGQTLVTKNGSDTGMAGADIDAPEAWDFEQGFSNPITVAVIDSGIDLNHPDLISKIWQNVGEIAGNSIDDDGNGYVDDVQGYNFAGISHYDYNWVQPVGGLKYKFGQSIKGTGQPLTHIGLNLLKVGNPPGDLVISIRDSLNGSDLATATVDPSEVLAAPSDVVVGARVDAYIPEVYKALDATVMLAADQSYYMVVDTTVTDPANYYLVADLAQGRNGYKPGDDVHIIKYDYYRDGTGYFQMDNSWLSLPTHDLRFRTNANAVARDDNGHGTHVSGIIGAATNNAIGIAGISPGAKIMPLKAGDSTGWFFSSDLIESIHYAADNGAKVINMSLGGDEFSVLEQLAVYYAAGKGVTLVAAAGNNGAPDDDNAIQYPAGYDDVIGVGATDNDDMVAVFSNHNSDVNFTAPGVNVLSTMPTYRVALNSEGYWSYYDYASGTSMASPMVAGVASLILAQKPMLNEIQVEKALEAGADDLTATPEPDLNPYWGRDPYYGYGRVNAYKSLMKLLLSTRLSSIPTKPNGTNGWYTSFPSLSLEVDATGATSYYNWDSTGSVSTYMVPFQPATEGIHVLNYYSALGTAIETTNTRIFGFDTGLPLNPDTISSSSHTTGTESADRTIDIGFSGASDTVSGIDGYSVSWSNNSIQTPSAVLNVPASSNSATSPSLTDGARWFNLRTKDWAGNWSSTVHFGPFLIDGAPTTGRLTNPGGPNGENNWYKTSPLVTLVPDEVAAVYYQLDSTSLAGWTGDIVPDISVSLNVPDGQHILYYFAGDGNNTETIKNSNFMKVDTGLPTGAVSINAGAAKTDSTAVVLTLSANDAVSGPAKMRFKNEGGVWSVWEAYAGSKPFWLTAGDGVKRVNAQFKDAAGNESTIVSDEITLKTDNIAPTASVVSPAISTNISKTKVFKTAWSAADPSPSSGIASYDVQYKIGSGGAWTSWKTGVLTTAANFTGVPGKTYYFRARAKDNSENTGGWSAISKTIVPYDQDSLILARAGFVSTLYKAASNFYLGTVRYSAGAGDKITYRFNGRSVALIAGKGPNRSKADIRVDGKYVKTIDNFSSTIKFRKNVFSVSWPSGGKHTVEITNKGTPGRTLLDVDAVAVGR